ncbi:MAG: dethiobiotin synthase [Rhodospirillaceae bacterium]|jgi:dethiobiotin synthase|nr:dethiobiotin synthase [Rhodospirillales bacterium]MBT3906203.1 dethiobiotin synthase [Rhodospirillaceae bacterium]MBT4702005.1 dethiobiotin synthase [Rhodospirillaceae bacterium]MBT5034721.1 dethiobiotin synthase [Rhodospirillaceae bacterium]MBT6221478.1 dethiobiotin synthase [Rhodospirillaceae bacterium]
MTKRGIFVTGTDTDIGKTIASACLVRALDADYWKPVQSGLTEGRDCDTISELTGLEESRIHPSTYELQAPLSPHEAARLEGLRLDMNQFKLPTTDNNLVVEGAGGVLVPINEGALMIDLIDQLDLPVVVVARSGLGTINHTLLTLEALRARNLELLGVIVSGPANSANIEAIRTYGKIKILLELEPISPLDSAGIDIAAKNLESEFS